MKFTFFFALLAVVTSSAAAQVCTFSNLTPIRTAEGTQYRFIDSCGQAYEVGYRLDGKTLHFPKGGQHTLTNGSDADAEKILRDTYGLIGKPKSLIRTNW